MSVQDHTIAALLLLVSMNQALLDVHVMKVMQEMDLFAMVS